MLLFKNTNILQLEDVRNAFLQTIIAIYICNDYFTPSNPIKATFLPEFPSLL